VARNTVLNLVGLTIPLVVAIAAVPVTVRALGVERFGILALAWIVLGYFSLFDLGLGRATTRFAAEALSLGQTKRFASLVWTSIGLQAALGLTGGVVLLGIAPFLVNHLLNVPPALVNEAQLCFMVLAAAIPATLVMGAARGALEAGHRFDLANLVGAPSSVLFYVLSALGAIAGLPLAGIVLLLVGNRVAAGLAYIALARRAFPAVSRITVDLSVAPSLLMYGGWVSVSSIVGPALVYADRFTIGAVLSLAAVAYYSAPFDVITRLLVIPAAMAMTLFPVFSATGQQREERLAGMYGRAMRYTLTALAPLVLLALLFGDELLRLWLGPDFARESALVFKLLSIGVLINAVGLIPSTLLQAIGRPDLTAKFHLAELAPFLILVWILTTHFGLIGTALAWVIRVSVDSTLLLLATSRMVPQVRQAYRRHRVVDAAFLILFLSLATAGGGMLALSAPTKLAIAMAVLSTLVVVTWRSLVDASDRALIGTVLGLLRHTGDGMR
jgi:O-antigen/teichoic acid export membrane protein